MVNGIDVKLHKVVHNSYHQQSIMKETYIIIERVEVYIYIYIYQCKDKKVIT